MSATLATTRFNVQQLLGDNNPDRRSVGSVRLNEIIKANAHTIYGRIIKPRESITTQATVAGTYDYSLSGETSPVAQVFLNSTGAEMAFVPFEIFNARYRQETDDPMASGTPGEYTLWEGTNNALRIRIGPTPGAVDSLKIHRSLMPSFSSPPDDADNLNFASDLLRAIEFAAAADCASLLGEDELAILKLSPAAGAMWRAKSSQAVRDYNVRASANGFRQDGVVRLRNFRWWR